MMNQFFKRLTENHPFITICNYAGQDYVGIVQNRDDNITSIYDYGSIVSADLKEKFLKLGDEWWWTSNRLIPINIFLRHDWDLFRPYLKTFNNKSLVILHGPTVSMIDLAKKRPKRRSITLVRKIG